MAKEKEELKVESLEEEVEQMKKEVEVSCLSSFCLLRR
jgi:hypothetical protein